MQRLLFLIGVAALANCSPPNQPAPQDTTSAATDTAPTDADGSAVFGAVPDKPVFELGTNITGKSTPEYYKALPEGAEINVELGPQGLWMVVLAFRTKNLLKPPMVLGGRVELEGALLGELKIAKQKLLPGPADFSYYYNFFLVVAPEGVAGKSAVITVTADDAEGSKVDLSHPVVLTGGK
jgi:hypothetical protein